ncbi:cytochrome c oxidase assembly protein COX16 homolog, mitochondrial isoform X1 [Meleagris gallopavo]|uniref:cytochrome c oxidase assembly protein COX16 homolog, mitochondrial isoform X1 n=1 Tax=Meleagris gallopavo TaxID=9103 RepID=UPI00093B4100|nr:cytochrome c oxidase assembly protein COX16 homolog, mitochondrial isoform X1 [Meleagris gallopavo]
MMSTNYMARCTKESCCPLDETAHGPVQPGLTCLQGWGTLLACHCDAEGHSGPSAADLQKVDPALKEKLKQNNVTLESEYKKLEKSDFDNWENIRGPQLWEDSRTVQKQRREAARLKTE